MIKIMKHRFLFIIALLLTAATGAWADDDPAPISLTSSANGTVWTLSTMPAYDVELEIEYYDPATLTAVPTAATSLEYSSEAQNLINAGTATGGTLYYGLGTSESAPTDASAWSETVPTGTDVGQYYVWYKVVGDGTHGDIAAAGPLEVNIAKATPTISEAPTAGAITYGQTLAESTLNGGSATCNSQTIAGSFAWTTLTTAPSVSDSENTEYSVTFTPTDGTNYNSATTNVKLTVNPVSAEGLTLTLSSESFTYNGEAQEPTVTVKHGETTLTQDTHYTVSYSNNTNAALSTAENAPTVTITGMGNYSGTASKKFTIAPKSLTDGMIQAIADQSYTGSALTPDITVKDGETTLVLGSDYESVTFTNNTNAALSTAENAPTVTITGKGNYTGTVSAKFTIAAADIATTDIKAPTANTLNFTGQAQALIVAGSVAGGIGTMQYSLDGTTWSTDIPTGTDEGDYTVYYKVVGDDNHNDVAAQSFKVTIGAALDIALTSTDGKTWTLASMPYYDVELEVEYYPAATLTTAPTSIGEVYATGSAQALVTGGEADGGSFEYALGTDDQTAPTTGWTATVPEEAAPGTYFVWYKVVGDATHSDCETAPACLTATIKGFPVTIASGEYVTYYSDMALTLEPSETEAKLYTISAVGTETATATEITSANAEMPFLIYNGAAAEKTIILIPTDATTNQAVASEFKGTLTGGTIAASTNTQNNYAFNGKQFVWVKEALPVAANKCWLEIPNSANAAPAMTIVFSEVTGIGVIDKGQLTNDIWYDLNGRKLQGRPTKKGVYINNGRKVVIK